MKIVAYINGVEIVSYPTTQTEFDNLYNDILRQHGKIILAKIG